MQKLLVFTSKRSLLYRFLVNDLFFAKIAETHLTAEFVYIGLLMPKQKLNHLLSKFAFRDYKTRETDYFIELRIFNN